MTGKTVAATCYYLKTGHNHLPLLQAIIKLSKKNILEKFTAQQNKLERKENWIEKGMTM